MTLPYSKPPHCQTGHSRTERWRATSCDGDGNTHGALASSCLKIGSPIGGAPPAGSADLPDPSHNCHNPTPYAANNFHAKV